MQDIVNFLIQNPDVVEKVLEGKASLLGVNLDELNVITEGLKQLSVKSDGGFWGG
ncbi:MULTISPECIES: competence pheromone ComX [Bacillus]|uniref:ComX pheromone n=1 Tax=Bacillus capparidis TaxID=1840411 RepID=A0ABS4CU00_9BACI|nr:MULTISPECIES: competence pheromone ComX [Bacillus]MBP1081047.1 competence protein ComX [Bacillus capparidis]MED1095739.1 competence pheromone ComX [Bacillus capparidis]